MNTENQSNEQRQVLAQPSTFGDPRPKENLRFYQAGKKVFEKVVGWTYPLTLASIFIFLCLVVFLSFFVVHDELYASDGTQYSCKVTTHRK